MIHKTTFAAIVALLPIVLPAYSDDDDDLMGKWYRRSDMDGVARSDAAFFTIGDKGYVVGGYDGKDRLSDCWEYDMDLDQWTQKADFPGVARNSAVATAVDDKGYLGTGYDGINYLNDFWEFDPTANTWTQKADYPGSARYGAVAFGTGGKAYVGCGYDGNYLKDFYAFDPATATWTQLRDISNSSDDDYDDDYTSIVREFGVAFVIDGVAYFTCGASGSIHTDTWKYYPTSDLWEEVRGFKGTGRTAAASFSSGKKGFVVSGKSGTTRFDDIWEFHPYEYDEDEY